MVKTNSILNFLGQNFGQIGKTFKAKDSPEVFFICGQLNSHLGSPHGEVGLAIWQNSKLSNSNVEWVSWECGSGLHNFTNSYSNLEKYTNCEVQLCNLANLMKTTNELDKMAKQMAFHINTS